MHRIVLEGQELTASALHPCNIFVRVGESVAIYGPPGSGKSLLLRVLALREPLHTGRLFLNGRLISQIGETESANIRAHELALLPFDHTMGPVGTTMQVVLLEADLIPRDQLADFLRDRPSHLPVIMATADPHRALLADRIFRMGYDRT